MGFFETLFPGVIAGVTAGMILLVGQFISKKLEGKFKNKAWELVVALFAIFFVTVVWFFLAKMMS